MNYSLNERCNYVPVCICIGVQCIPTPLAWYAHQFPEWLQKLSVVTTYVIEIAIPLLFFLPVRSLRILGFLSQVIKLVLGINSPTIIAILCQSQ